MLEKITNYLHLLVEPKFKAFYKTYKDKAFTLLDVGCGNHSPTRTVGIFKGCTYHGVDREIYNNNAEDLAVMEKFYQVDLTRSDLSGIPDASFDVVLAYHVLEHIPNGLDVVAILARKLKPGGEIYLEFPSVRSLRLPSVVGTLNFCDDASHVRIYEVKELANLLLSLGFRIVKAGPRRDLFCLLITPFFYLYLKYFKKLAPASAFWDITGFADFVHAVKTAPVTGPLHAGKGSYQPGCAAQGAERA